MPFAQLPAPAPALQRSSEPSIRARTIERWLCCADAQGADAVAAAVVERAWTTDLKSTGAPACTLLWRMTTPDTCSCMPLLCLHCRKLRLMCCGAEPEAKGTRGFRLGVSEGCCDGEAGCLVMRSEPAAPGGKACMRRAGVVAWPGGFLGVAWLLQRASGSTALSSTAWYAHGGAERMRVVCHSMVCGMCGPWVSGCVREPPGRTLAQVVSRHSVDCVQSKAVAALARAARKRALNLFKRRT